MNNTPTPRTDAAANESIVAVYKESQKLERELVAAIAQTWELGSKVEDFKEQLKDVTKQRDALADALTESMKHMRHGLNCHARVSQNLHACNCQMEWAYNNAKQTSAATKGEKS